MRNTGGFGEMLKEVEQDGSKMPAAGTAARLLMLTDLQ